MVDGTPVMEGNGTWSVVAGRCWAKGLKVLMAAMGTGSGGIEVSMVFLLLRVDIRRTLLLILVYDDLREEDELMEDGAEVMVEEVGDDVLVRPGCSLELHELGWVESEVREGGGWSSDEVELRWSAETFLVTNSRVVVGSCGRLIPSSRAVRTK